MRERKETQWARRRKEEKEPKEDLLRKPVSNSTLLRLKALSPHTLFSWSTSNTHQTYHFLGVKSWIVKDGVEHGGEVRQHRALLKGQHVVNAKTGTWLSESTTQRSKYTFSFFMWWNVSHWSIFLIQPHWSYCHWKFLQILARGFSLGLMLYESTKFQHTG